VPFGLDFAEIVVAVAVAGSGLGRGSVEEAKLVLRVV